MVDRIRQRSLLPIFGLTPAQKFQQLDMQGEQVRPFAQAVRRPRLDVPRPMPQPTPITRADMPLGRAALTAMSTGTSAPLPKDPTMLQRLQADKPFSAGLQAAGQALSEASGYTDMPKDPLGMINQALAAFNQAQRQQAQFEAEMALKKQIRAEDVALKREEIEAKKPSGMFAGQSMTAQSYNKLIELSPRIANGTATPAEKQAYSLIYQDLSRPVTETRETDAGTVTVQRPPIDLSRFATPEGVQKPTEKIVGEKMANFNDSEALAAGFANRIRLSLDTLDRLESQGFSPVNFRDAAADALGANFAKTPEGQLYQRAKEDFVTAVLRRESGAAIAESEFIREDKKYFPQIGDTQQVVEEKAKARHAALKSMIAGSGAAYSVMFPEEQGIVLPQGSQLLKEIGGKKYFKTPAGDILVVDK